MVQQERASSASFRRAESKLAALSPALVSRGVAFWLNQGVGLKQDTCLPDIFLLNLRAMCRTFEQVELFVYQPLKFDLELPGLKLLDARDHLTEEKALDLLGQGWKVQHLADFVRLLALRRTGGFFLDLDQLWLDAGRLKLDRRAFGHLGSSVKVKFMRGAKKLWLQRYLRQPGEEVYFSVPLHFPAGSFLLELSLFYMPFLCGTVGVLQST